MIGRIVRLARKNVLVSGIAAAAFAALLASFSPLFVTDVAAGEAGCVDLGCRSHVQCEAHKCDLCHSDNRCALIPGGGDDSGGEMED